MAGCPQQLASQEQRQLITSPSVARFRGEQARTEGALLARDLWAPTPSVGKGRRPGHREARLWVATLRSECARARHGSACQRDAPFREGRGRVRPWRHRGVEGPVLTPGPRAVVLFGNGAVVVGGVGVITSVKMRRPWSRGSLAGYDQRPNRMWRHGSRGAWAMGVGLPRCLHE